MSAPVREEDRQKSSSSSRGLGLAAAAIGVGVGAALYYFFSKQPDVAGSEGAHASGWTSQDQQAFRQRRWSLEECSICCEVMLNDQQLQTLACSHHFHAACVRPWLEEHQTCPNCRKAA